VDFSQSLSTPITWWQVLWAIVALLAGWIASRIAKRALTAALARRGWSSTVTSEAVVPPLVPGDPV
jgi:hypothetical protein